jgi:RecQ family ATP-dependent DNA helicase
MRFCEQRALELLRAGTGVADATFRPGQCEAIQHVVEGRGRLLLVQKTGWGKSNVYFIAAKLLREGGLGPALLFSPLLALMRNQIDAAVRMGVRALTIHSDNQEEWGQIEQAVEADQVDVLLISPERLANARFMADVLAGIAARVSLIVIDEAHCISDWGHDFRPHYRLIERMSRNLPATTHLVATTATANNRVMADLRDVLGPQLTVARGDLRRPSLSLQTIRMPDQADRLAWLACQLTQLPGSGIIYVLTKRDAQTVAAWLQSRGRNVAAYTSETGSDRIGLEQALLRNRVKALVATSALAMGFDKPDLAFVIHFQTPGSVVAYYQQVGRAGRALDRARGVLLSGAEEADINDFFITTAFPTRDEAAAGFESLSPEAAGLLQVICEKDSTRMAAPVERLGAVFAEAGFDGSPDEAGVKAGVVKRHGCALEGVYLQERHVCQAFQEALAYALEPDAHVELLTAAYGVPPKASIAEPVAEQNEIRSQLLKAGKPAYVAETFVDFDHARRLILALGCIPCYPIVADGAKPVCPFEEDPAKLAEAVRGMGVHCTEFIPDRNSPETLAAYAHAMRGAGLVVTAGTEHYTRDLIPIEPACKAGAAIPDDVADLFWEGACVMAAHTYVACHGRPGFVDAGGAPNSAFGTDDERITWFAAVGAEVIAAYRQATT